MKPAPRIQLDSAAFLFLKPTRSNSRSRESSKHSSPKFEPSLYQSQHISLLQVLRLFIVLSERVLFSHHQLNEYLELIRFQFTEGCVPCGGYLRGSLSRVPTNHVVLLLDPASSQKALKWWVYWIVLISSWALPLLQTFSLVRFLGRQIVHDVEDHFSVNRKASS